MTTLDGGRAGGDQATSLSAAGKPLTRPALATIWRLVIISVRIPPNLSSPRSLLSFAKPSAPRHHPCGLSSMLLSHIRLSWTSLRSLRPLQPSRFFSISRSRYNIEMGTVETTQRLAQLRQLMQEHKVDVYSMPPLCLPRSICMFLCL